MDFAKKILLKYGWKDGDGLGKNNDGITKPIKAALKFDNAGFGADQAATDFNNHWWERVFNEAASNVEIKQDDGQVKMNLKNDTDGVEISTKGYSIKKLKKAKQSRKTEKDYDNFIQAATLTNQGDEIENPDKIDADDIEVTKVKVLTDEELFKACGGRTAHKGARHGLKLSGKLSRVEQQEKELLAIMMEKKKNALSDCISLRTTQKEKSVTHKNEDDEVSKKKKHKFKEISLEGCETEECNNPQLECTKSRKEKKKRKHSKDKIAEKKSEKFEIQLVRNKKCKIDINEHNILTKNVSKLKKKQRKDVE